jgi:hypothetical protein
MLFFENFLGEMAELAEGARLLSECATKVAPRVRIPVSPPFIKKEPVFGCRKPALLLGIFMILVKRVIFAESVISLFE